MPSSLHEQWVYRNSKAKEKKRLLKKMAVDAGVRDARAEHKKELLKDARRRRQ